MDYSPTLVDGTNVAGTNLPVSIIYSEKDGAVMAKARISLQPTHKKDASHTGVTVFYIPYPEGLAAENVIGKGVSLEGDSLICDPDQIVIGGEPTNVIRCTAICTQSPMTNFYLDFGWAI